MGNAPMGNINGRSARPFQLREEYVIVISHNKRFVMLIPIETHKVRSFFCTYAQQIVLEVILRVFALFSVLSNTLLIILIVHGKNRALGSYRYLLSAFAFGDITISVYHGYAVPVLHRFRMSKIN